MRSRFVAYVTLPHFTPLTIVVVVTGLLAWMIDGSSLSGAELGRLLLAMLGGQLLVGITNELIDSDADRLSKPSKPIPAGLVSRRGAVLFGAGGLILMLVAGSSFGALSFSILLIGTGTGIAYSLWFKRSPFAWLPYLIALPLLPIWVAVSLDRFDPALLLLYPLGALAVLGVQLAQSIPDIDADRAAGIDSVTTRLGESPSALALLVLAARLAGAGVDGCGDSGRIVPANGICRSCGARVGCTRHRAISMESPDRRYGRVSVRGGIGGAPQSCLARVDLRMSGLPTGTGGLYGLNV